MGSRDVEVTCPSCSSRLVVDVRTEKVVRCRRPEERDAAGKPKVSADDWSSAMGRVEGRRGAGEERFDESLRREKGRAQDLDRLFEDLERRRDEAED